MGLSEDRRLYARVEALEKRVSALEPKAPALPAKPAKARATASMTATPPVVASTSTSAPEKKEPKAPEKK